MAAPEPIALVMAGGSGTRFWPLSTRAKPKQYIPFIDDRSLIQHTVDRISPLVLPGSVVVCAHVSHENMLRQQLPETTGLILEPVGRNTTACLMLSVATLLMRGARLDTPLVALPADHFISHADRFREVIQRAIRFCRGRSSLVTLGIVPTRPHSGFGYIEVGTEAERGVFTVKSFKEKPDAQTAEKFVASRQFFWNAGIFVWTLQSIIQAFEEFQSSLWRTVRGAVESHSIAAIYPSLPSIPIDIAIMEKAQNAFLVKADNMGWSDLGSWDALYELKASAGTPNVVLSGQAKMVESRGCLVRAPAGRKVALVGVSNLIVVEEGDTLLIADRASDQLVREASNEFDPDGI